MKQTLDLRPVCHRLADGVHAHVILCWLALLLTGTATNRSRATPAVLTEDDSPRAP